MWTSKMETPQSLIGWRIPLAGPLTVDQHMRNGESTECH